MRASQRIGARAIGVASIAALLAATGCSSDQPTSPNGAVYVTVSPAWLSHTAAPVAGDPGIHFSIDAAIHNNGSSDVQFTPMVRGSDSGIERRTGNGWSAAIAGGNCPVVPGMPIVIPAHTTVVRHIEVSVRLAVAWFADVPVWSSPSPTGIYRVHFDLTADNVALPESESASAPFVITD